MSDNLFSGLPSTVAVDEQFRAILQRPGLKIERIVSTGQASPEGFWYDQPNNEWVLVLQGEARLRLADESTVRHLKCGDFLDIPAHCRHRVEWTPAGELTVWLAIHYRDDFGQLLGRD